MNLMHVFETGDMVLMGTFILLIVLSVLSWTIILWKAGSVISERNALKRFRASQQEAVLSPFTSGSAGGATGELLAEARHAAGTAECYQGQERILCIETLFAHALDRIRVRLDGGLTFLASIGSAAPFIGLFGTVWGIYGALVDIAAAGNARLDVVAGPMGEALVATAIGLFAAIPAVLAYNMFVRLNRLLIQDLRHIAERLELGMVLPSADTAQDTMRIVQAGGR